MFEYCLNVPNRFTDPDGRFPIIGFISCFIFASVYLAADVVAKRINDVYPDEDITDRARSKVLSIPFRIAEIRKDMNIPLDASLKVSIGVRNYSGFESVADSFSATNLISVTTSPFGWPGVIIGIALSLSYSALRPNQMPGSYAYISYEFTHDYQIAFHSSDPTETEPYLVETFTETWTVTDMFDGAYKNDFSLESYEDTGFPYKGASTSPIEIIY